MKGFKSACALSALVLACTGCGSYNDSLTNTANRANRNWSAENGYNIGMNNDMGYIHNSASKGTAYKGNKIKPVETHIGNNNSTSVTRGLTNTVRNAADNITGAAINGGMDKQLNGVGSTAVKNNTARSYSSSVDMATGDRVISDSLYNSVNQSGINSNLQNMNTTSKIKVTSNAGGAINGTVKNNQAQATTHNNAVVNLKADNNKNGTKNNETANMANETGKTNGVINDNKNMDTASQKNNTKTNNSTTNTNTTTNSTTNTNLNKTSTNGEKTDTGNNNSTVNNNNSSNETDNKSADQNVKSESAGVNMDNNTQSQSNATTATKTTTNVNSANKSTAPSNNNTNTQTKTNTSNNTK